MHRHLAVLDRDLDRRSRSARDRQVGFATVRVVARDDDLGALVQRDIRAVVRERRDGRPRVIARLSRDDGGFGLRDGGGQLGAAAHAELIAVGVVGVAVRALHDVSLLL